MKSKIALWLLILALIFLAFGGFYGGIAMLLDPSGRSLEMDAVLARLPVANFTLPGLFLLVVMGVGSLLFVYGLLARPAWRWAEALTGWSGFHWAWAGTILLGVVLGIWLVVQGLLIGFKWQIQYITAVNGLLIILLVLLPGVRSLFK
ncbi:MAG: hypothetical protein IBX69_14390 [Anaerolineales bacterium]|nr:hypothetical protein [Anaerolineales bacterium]